MPKLIGNILPTAIKEPIYEIERKFLLKSIPDGIKPIEIIKIDQYYLKNLSGVWERARLCDSNVNGVKYVHTVKQTVAKGVNLEDEYLMTEAEFTKFRNVCLKSNRSRYIAKERCIYPHTSDGLKWEVDIFNSGHHLIVAEIEIPRRRYPLVLPEFIDEKLLLEVTGLKQFSNKNLSNWINEKVRNTK